MDAQPSRLAANPALARWRELPQVHRRGVGGGGALGVAPRVPLPGARRGPHVAARPRPPPAARARGLNIVVGFAGLLDLGYAAFFAIGAYGYGIAASAHLKLPWSSIWMPLVWLGQMTRVQVAGQPDFVQLHFSFWAMLFVGGCVC